MGDGPIHQGIERASEKFGDRPAILAGERRWSFRQIDSLSNSLALELASGGIERDNRVAVMMDNRAEFVICVYAISKLGAASVLLSPAWRAREIEHAVELTKPSRAIADEAAAPLLASLLGEGAVSDIDDPGTSGAAFSRDDSRLAVREIDPKSDAVLVFSSGTTGLPKAVRHTHVSLGCATSHWVSALALGPDDRFQIATPPSHILGLLNLLAAASAGATVRLHRRFDLDELLERVSTEHTTLEMAVAPIALAIANHPDLEKYDLSSLRYIMWGATPVSEAVAQTVTRRCGVRWLPAYGASEVPVLAVNPVADPRLWRLDSAGLPPSGVELRVVDLDSGDVLEPGAIGEIQARSASAMAGYLPEEANTEAFSDGWYRTGDVGWLEPAGWVHITDRCKEMIKVSGFQVAPAEIEAVLHGHPSVLDCAVFGVPDERAGELPVAAVALDPQRPVSAEELKGLVASSLATYKALHDVVIVDDIPRLASGKVLRRVLRERWVTSPRVP